MKALNSFGVPYTKCALPWCKKKAAEGSNLCKKHKKALENQGVTTRKEDP